MWLDLKGNFIEFFYYLFYREWIKGRILGNGCDESLEGYIYIGSKIIYFCLELEV